MPESRGWRRIGAALRSALLDNFFVKLATLLAAVGSWAWIQGEREVQVAAWVEVSYELPAELVLTQAPPPRVRATLSGTRGEVRQVQRSEDGLRLDVDLTELGPGLQTVDFVGGDIIGLPDDVFVSSLAPNTLQVELEPKDSRTVRVEAAVVGEVSEGYRIQGISIQPEQVVIQGPASGLASLDVVATEGINVANLTETTSHQVGLTLPRNVVLVGDGVLTATVTIEAVSSSRTFLDVPVVSRSPGWSPMTTAVDVKVTGPVRDVQAVRGDLVTVLAVVSPDASDDVQTLRLGDGDSRLQVVHSGSASVVVTEISPSRIQVEPTE
jgi:YbbR domain-containing protein